jgi:hypothetical protein
VVPVSYRIYLDNKIPFGGGEWLDYETYFLLDYVLRVRIRRKSKEGKNIFKINAKDMSIHSGLYCQIRKFDFSHA